LKFFINKVQVNQNIFEQSMIFVSEIVMNNFCSKIKLSLNLNISLMTILINECITSWTSAIRHGILRQFESASYTRITSCLRPVCRSHTNIENFLYLFWYNSKAYSFTRRIFFDQSSGKASAWERLYISSPEPTCHTFN